MLKNKKSESMLKLIVGLVGLAFIVVGGVLLAMGINSNSNQVSAAVILIIIGFVIISVAVKVIKK